MLDPARVENGAPPLRLPDERILDVAPIPDQDPVRDPDLDPAPEAAPTKTVVSRVPAMAAETVGRKTRKDPV